MHGLYYWMLSALALARSAVSMSTATMNPQPKIAVIGSGAAGLAALRIFTRSSRHLDYDVTCLEKDAAIGGVWDYKSDSADKPMYMNLRTNLPKDIMAFREFSWSNKPHSFVTHQEVNEYLKEYRDHFELEQHIKYGCRVTRLTCLPETRSEVSPKEEDWPQIRIDWTDSNKIQHSEAFDGVLVCNGHYNRPAFPLLPGLHEYFTGQTLHSIAYDKPDRFANQKVLCVGGRASGADIAREISHVAQHVYLSDTTCTTVETQDNVTWVPATKTILNDGRVAFDDVATKTAPVAVDTIIFCSGYDYDFPFINEESNLELDTTGRRVRPLFEQLWHAVFPNVAFVGLPHSVVPFPLFEFQCEAVEKSWSAHTVLPGLKERTEAAERAALSGGEGKPNGRVPQDTHFLGPKQWDYCRKMARYAGVYDNKVEDFIATQEVIYDDAGEERKGAFPAGPDTYRSICYKRLDEQHSFERWMPGEKTESARV